MLQEVAVSSEAVVRRGPHEVAWDSLCDLICYTQKIQTMKAFENITSPEFFESVQLLRKTPDSAEGMSFLQLIHAFRFQSATFCSAKFYALLGLLLPDNPSLQALEYDKTPGNVFMTFTLSCFTYNKNLTILALAAGAAIRDVSWCRDWRLTSHSNCRPFEAVSFSRVEKRDQKYSAFGTKIQGNQADLAHGLLLLQGYEVDTIEKVGIRRHVKEYMEYPN